MKIETIKRGTILPETKPTYDIEDSADGFLVRIRATHNGDTFIVSLPIKDVVQFDKFCERNGFV